jgi:hypothetical protein
LIAVRSILEFFLEVSTVYLWNSGLDCEELFGLAATDCVCRYVYDKTYKPHLARSKVIARCGLHSQM